MTEDTKQLVKDLCHVAERRGVTGFDADVIVWTVRELERLSAMVERLEADQKWDDLFSSTVARLIGKSMNSGFSAKDVASHIEHLESIVAKLPRTAYGVPVVPGMEVFHLWGGKVYAAIVECRTNEWWADPYQSGEFDDYRGTDTVLLHNCYSTKEAAQRALAQKEGE